MQAEVLKDFRVLAPDLADEEIAAEILRLRGAPLLTGFRGAAPADIAALAETAGTLGRIMLAYPRILEIDLTPVVVHARGSGVVALDALMMIDA